ncbi:MAG: AraC family transcriptional regulator, partial [Tidjanibacter sp.]|nr:AraC family transcriptional regulator [Tidjanibacter sp.]
KNHRVVVPDIRMHNKHTSGSEVRFRARCVFEQRGFLEYEADSLGFESQSLFGKYFKRVTGISPRSYRKQILDKQ